MIEYKAMPSSPIRKPRPAKKILDGLNEAIAIAKGESEPHKVHKPKPDRKRVTSRGETKTEAKRAGRPPTGKARRQISIRLDEDIVQHFESQGDGWRSLINEALRKAIQTN